MLPESADTRTTLAQALNRSTPKRSWTFGLFAALFLVGVTSGQAQTPSGDVPQADPTDVESVDAIVAAVYDVISGPAGETRDWDRWRSLFLPEARLASVSVNPEGEVRYRVFK